MDDATLVEAARSGDGSAWATIYDRYADRLHDHCHRILRDRDEAADALHDAFVAATRNLHQLRDPSRLRPWLYSICRHEALRRARRRQRVQLTDELEHVSAVEGDHDGPATASELQELVWAAAEGLGERDQALLDLNLRQGLEGQDLADAMGVSLSASYVLMSRLRDQVERSLGALLIARLGRDDCPDLATVLAGWDGRFTVLLRKRVARHVDRCGTCTARRSIVLSPAALLAASPLVPAPADLRDRVLTAVAGPAPGPEIRFSEAGFAASVRPGRRGRGWWAAAAAVVAIVGLAAGAFALSGGDDDEPVVGELAAAEASTTTTGSEPVGSPHTSPARTGSSTTAEATTAPTTSTTAAVVAPSTPPQGAPSAADPEVGAPPTPEPDQRPPVIGEVTASADAIQTSCNPANDAAQVEASVTDDRGLRSVVLSWSGAPGGGSVPMARDGSVHRATLPSAAPFTIPGTVTYTVTATDEAGNRTRSPAGTLEVLPCPG